MTHEPESTVLSTSRTVLIVVSRLNLATGAFIFALLATSFILKTFLFTALAGHDPHGESLVWAMRGIMIFGLVAVALVHMIVELLVAMVDTVRAGDPFVAQNAERLKRIAWLVLGLEVLHLVIALLAASGSTAAHPIDIKWSFNITRWLVVLMLFVLAKVFEHGTRMRDDLEGTV